MTNEDIILMQYENTKNEKILKVKNEMLFALKCEQGMICLDNKSKNNEYQNINIIT